jgi:hypothetical protein
MRGVVVIPNEGSGCAAIQRTDGFIVVVEPPPDLHLDFLDTVDVGDVQPGARLRLFNLTQDLWMDVGVRKIDVDLPWEEKMAMLGKRTS